MLLAVYLFLSFLVGRIFITRFDQRSCLLDVPAQISLGLMFGGVCWIVSLLGGFSPKVGTISLMAIGGLASLWMNGLSLQVPARDSLFKHLPIFIVSFACFGGVTLSASFYMGQGTEFPLVFFNLDTPFRLGLSHSFVDAETYPPFSIFNLGARHAYHYGAPAAVAALSSLTGLTVHKSMFWVFCPIVLIGAFSLLFRLILSLGGSRLSSSVSILLFVPSVLVISLTYSWLTSSDLHEIFIDLFLGLNPIDLNPERFSGTARDASMITGHFLLFWSGLICFQNSQRQIVLPLIAACILIVFFKLDLAVAVYGILFIAIWFNQASVSVKGKILTSLLMPTIGVVFLIVLGYWRYEFGVNQIELRTTWPLIVERMFNGFSNWEKTFLREIVFGVTVGSFALVCRFRQSAEMKRNAKIVIGISVTSLGALLLARSISIPKVDQQLLGGVWFGGSLAIAFCAVMVVRANAKLVKVSFLVAVVPFCMVGIAVAAVKVSQTVAMFLAPEQGSEFFSNRLLGPAMAAIEKDLYGIDDARRYERYVDSYPKLLAHYEKVGAGVEKGTWGKYHYEKRGREAGRVLPAVPIVVTNDFNYVTWPDSNPAIPALFGHQAFATHPRIFPGPSGYNKRVGRIWLQEKRLGDKFSRENMAFFRETMIIAKKFGWTHFVLKKHSDPDRAPRDSRSIPLEKIFENQTYAVFRFIQTKP